MDYRRLLQRTSEGPSQDGRGINSVTASVAIQTGPTCTFDENCGNDNEPLQRASAVGILDLLLGEEHGSTHSEYVDRDAQDDDCRPVIFYS